MKQIVIEGNKYDIDCNGLTYVLHKTIFNRGIMQDIHILQNYIIVQTLEINKLKNKFPDITEEQIDNQIFSLMGDYIDDFIEAVTRIAYTLMYTANEKIASYEDFLRSIKNLKIDDDWIVEVAEFAVSTFC